MYERKIPIDQNCGLDLIREVLYGKWKIHLLYYISRGIQRPSELQREIPEATRRVLNVQLNQLEQHELITKKIYPQLPPKVEYSLTPFGESLLPVVMLMGKWGDDNQEHLKRVILKDSLESVKPQAKVRSISR
ncbi:winged helix-turn-helix transcriptional regulator [Mucilaginibacter aquaedulcis]|uniref:winged helix-turn-helix transcriptional regulator n=1 Tax=Mucilaginibacter aquaedulcis TaxID=1187081 RepID=UPI0025B51E34|nr:helix-turn-helix domain-containing protein [Mucilaginibacter aquaedulcis]MDN3550327.1 helix-turn-helix domain-containing protein [Mucilaginibacter aquaedulcis]